MALIMLLPGMKMEMDGDGGVRTVGRRCPDETHMNQLI